jgi:monoterpene epsilon-lactone hydrolase
VCPLQLHVGSSEVLLDDTLRFAKSAEEQGVAVTTHLWKSMQHVFNTGLPTYDAAEAALKLTVDFIKSHI